MTIAADLTLELFHSRSLITELDRQTELSVASRLGSCQVSAGDRDTLHILTL